MNELSFKEFNPDEAEIKQINQVGAFLKQNVWQVMAPSDQELEFYRSYHLAIAIDQLGQLAAAGAMLGGSKEYYLADMATEFKYRRTCNLGTTILSMLEAKASRNGAVSIRGWALKDALQFFFRRGYLFVDPSDPFSNDIRKKLT